ncbi:hypothetical protein [Actinokineospora pegani]|uniref:hypothetical protein n=1 Tax=Actinokineospora pegani TaxID=2654637 RepID=UPI0012EA33EF|nr:hypothetical protein [Actinokineospora pegani]
MTPSHTGARPTANPRPKLVDQAVWLTLGGVAVNAAGTLFQVFTDRVWVERTARELSEGFTGAGPITPGQVVAAGVLGVVAMIGLFALLVVKARAGREWSRIALAGLAALGAAGFLAEVASVGPAPVLAVDLADAAFRVVGAAYLFRPESTRFFHLVRSGIPSGATREPIPSGGMTSNDPNQPSGQQPGQSPQYGQEPQYGQAPQYGQQPGQYQPMPSAPPVGHGAPPARPKQVDTSFMLWLVNAGINILSFIVTLTIGADILRDQVRDQVTVGGGLSESEIDSAVTAALTVSGVIAVGFFALYVLFAFKMRAGRNWARITLTVLGVLGVLSGLYSLASGDGGVVGILLSVVQVVLIGTALFLMWQKPSTEYFEASKRVG